MDLQTLANLGEFLGGIGVIVSLVYLAGQVRSNTRSQRSDSYAHALARVSGMQDQMAKDDEYARIFNAGRLEH